MKVKWLAPGIGNVIEEKSSICSHLGDATGETITCPSCKGRVELKLFSCGVFGQCTLVKAAPGVACCNGTLDERGALQPCPHYSPLNAGSLALREAAATSSESSPSPKVHSSILKWSYGVTTVPERIDSGLLDRTLGSLNSAGFDKPRLFVDGLHVDEASKLTIYRDAFRLEITTRWPSIRTAANWTLALWELYAREPHSDRYAIFQDDFVTYPNLRYYLEACPYPEQGYLNLYTFPSEQSKMTEREGWYVSNQNGRGAVALIFSREAVVTLLSQLHLVQRPQDLTRGHKAIDGGIVESMKKAGWKEWVHNPSLVQHVGLESSMGNKPHKQSLSFKGESFDAMGLLK